MPAGTVLERRVLLGRPVDLLTTLGPLRHGHWDPTMRLEPTGVWRTTRTPEGPATVHYRATGPARGVATHLGGHPTDRLRAPGARVGDPDPGQVLVEAWGPGAAHELDLVDQVLGAEDDPAGFEASAHPVMAAAFRRFGAGWRVPRTGRVLESLVPAVLEQRVTGLEATRAWARLVREFGERAPGPAGLWLAPAGADWARVPSWAWHRAGVDPGRARTIVRVAGRSAAVERLSDLSPGEAVATLTTQPGVGEWTAAEVAVRAWGHRDAVSFGDFHLAGFVVWALTGQRGGTDDEMARLLVPWAGQRARAVRMLELHCPRPPARGPRATVTDHRRH